MEPEARYLWHTTPLFHLPHLLATGAIFSATQIVARGLPVRPRPSAIRRKTRLGLANFVHLSPAPQTPLLRDKLQRGYPHALLRFPRAGVLALPGVSLLRYNTKRWAHRDDFSPVTDAAEMATVWAAHNAGKYPSLEILVPGMLPLSLADALLVRTDGEADLVRGVVAALAFVSPPVRVSPDTFPVCAAPTDLAGAVSYFAQCKSAGRVLSPPALLFD